MASAIRLARVARTLPADTSTAPWWQEVADNQDAGASLPLLLYEKFAADAAVALHQPAVACWLAHMLPTGSTQEGHFQVKSTPL